MQLQEALMELTIKRRNKIIKKIDKWKNELTIHDVMAQEFAEFMQTDMFNRLDIKTQNLLMLVTIMQDD